MKLKFRKAKPKPREEIPDEFFIKGEDLKYEKWYNSLIERARTRDPEILEIYEVHHILPKCLGGGNEDENVVALTLKEHVFAHKILTKIYPHCPDILAAAYLMLTPGPKTKRKGEVTKYFSIREAAYYRELAAKARSLRWKSFSEEKKERIKKKLSESHKGYVASKETREKLSRINKGKSPATKGKKLPKRPQVGPKLRTHWNSLPEETKKKKIEQLRKIGEKAKLYHVTTKVEGPNGEIYNSVKETAKVFGVSRQTIRHWINSPKKNFKYMDKR